MFLEWQIIALLFLLVALCILAPVVVFFRCSQKKAPPAPIITTDDIQLREL